MLNEALNQGGGIPKSSIPSMTNPYSSLYKPGTVTSTTASHVQITIPSASQSETSSPIVSQSGTSAQHIVGMSNQSASSRQTVSQLLGKQQTPAGARRPTGPTTIHTSVIQQAPLRPVAPSLYHPPYSQIPVSQTQVPQYATYSQIPFTQQNQVRPLINPLVNPAPVRQSLLPPQSLYSQIPAMQAGQLQQTFPQGFYQPMPLSMVRVTTPSTLETTTVSVGVPSQSTLTSSVIYSTASATRPPFAGVTTAMGQPMGSSHVVGQPMGSSHVVVQPTGQSSNGQQQQHSVGHPQTLGQAITQIIGPALRSISPALTAAGQLIAPASIRAVTTNVGQPAAGPTTPSYRPISPALYPTQITPTTASGVTIANVVPQQMGLPPRTAMPSFLSTLAMQPSALTQVLFTQPPVAAYSLAQSQQLANALMPSVLPVLRQQPVGAAPAPSVVTQQPVMTQIITTTAHPTNTAASIKVVTTPSPTAMVPSTVIQGAPSTVPPAPPTMVHPTTMTSYFNPALQAALGMSPFPVTLGPPLTLNKVGQVTTPTYSSMSLGTAAALQRLTMSPLQFQSPAIPITAGAPTVPQAAMLAPMGVTAAKIPTGALTTVPITKSLAVVNNPAVGQRVKIEPAPRSSLHSVPTMPVTMPTTMHHFPVASSITGPTSVPTTPVVTMAMMTPSHPVPTKSVAMSTKSVYPAPITPFTVQSVPTNPMVTMPTTAVNKGVKRPRPPTPKNNMSRIRTKKEKLLQSVATVSQREQSIYTNTGKVGAVKSELPVVTVHLGFPNQQAVSGIVSKTEVLTGASTPQMPLPNKYVNVAANNFVSTTAATTYLTGVSSTPTSTPVTCVAQPGVHARMPSIVSTRSGPLTTVARPGLSSQIIAQASAGALLSVTAKTVGQNGAQQAMASATPKTSNHGVMLPATSSGKLTVAAVEGGMHPAIIPSAHNPNKITVTAAVKSDIGIRAPTPTSKSSDPVSATATVVLVPESINVVVRSDAQAAGSKAVLTPASGKPPVGVGDGAGGKDSAPLSG